MSEIRVQSRVIDFSSTGIILLKPNPKRTGWIVENDTDTALFIGFNDLQPTVEQRALSVPSRTTFSVVDQPADQVYKGIISFALSNATGGRLFVTEFFAEETG